MRLNLIGAFVVNHPFGTEIAFQKGFEALGHELHIVDPNLETQILREEVDATIVFKTAKAYNPLLKNVSGVKIVYQPDDYRFPHIRDMMAEMREFCDFAMAFDDTSADAILKSGYRLARGMIVTADPDLYRYVPGTKKDIDLCFVGSIGYGGAHQSRMRMLRVLNDNGFSVGYTSDLYDIPKIVELYNRAKVVLNHATDVGQPFGHGFGYQCRHFEAGFTKACLLSNAVYGERKLKNYVSFDSEETLVSSAQSLLENASTREGLAQMYYDELNASHRPEHRAAEIVSFIRECQDAQV